MRSHHCPPLRYRRHQAARPHVPYRRRRRDSFEGSLGARRFNIMVMLRIGKAKISMKTTLVAVLRLKNPKPPMAWRCSCSGPLTPNASSLLSNGGKKS
jgi:hypothetical protein